MNSAVNCLRVSKRRKREIKKERIRLGVNGVVKREGIRKGAWHVSLDITYQLWNLGMDSKCQSYIHFQLDKTLIGTSGQ